MLSPSLRERIAAQRSEVMAALAEEQALPKGAVRPVGARHALSHFQERLWIIQQLDPNGTEYNLVTVWPMPDGVPDRIAAAVRGVAERHAILRTAFEEAAEGPEAVILGADAVDIQRHSLAEQAQDDQIAAIRAEIERQVHLPFDLETAPPARFMVYDLGPRGAALLVAAHHIALDHWSLSLLRNAITRAAAAPSDADSHPSLHYADYADWSRQQLSPARLSEGLDWWQAQLAGHPELCAFPADGLPQIRPRGSSRSFSWDAALTDQLRSLAQRHGVSIYMCLVAACAVALHRETGLEDIVIGNPVATRELAEFEELIGPFVNTLAMRFALHPEDRFATVLARVRDALLDAHGNRDIPFELVIERLQPPRSFNRSPLFQVAVVLQDGSGSQTEPIYGGGAVHDLTWFVREVGGELLGSIEFRADVYHDDTIERLLGRLKMIVQQAVTDPALPVGAFALLTEAERRTLTEAFIPAAQDTGSAPFPRQFERLAAEQGKRPAVTCGGETLDYAALNARANRITHLLRERNVGAGDLVGLCIERSIDMLAGLIALQKARAVYVPLDPAFPPARLAMIAADSGAVAILGDRRSLRRFDSDGPATLIALDDDAAALGTRPSENPQNAPGAADLSHIIYTSGSTGKPKGVAITHGAFSNLLASLRQEPGIAPDDVVAATTTVSFDIAAVELLLPLTVGARIELMSRDTATDGAAWSAALQACGATVVQATPSAWRILLEAEWPGGADIKAITGGEPLTRELADRLLDRVGGLWNGYGPSETTVYSTGGWVEPGEKAISIGRPVANTRVYVLDPRGDLAPIGHQGEICIGGAGVAQGYLGRPDETDARFIPDPFGPPGARIYRTGDLGRWSPEGALYHLGRGDHQVKIRGARVELGEIEAALVATEDILHAVVIAHDTGDDRRLVAYVVYAPGADMTASDVRRALRARLPAYMIPAIIVELPSMPLLPNGKLDRRALPDPFAQTAERVRHVPPAPGLETTLAGIWSRVLSIEAISASDNFFELGGHSLLTLRVAKAVDAELGLYLDPRLLFLKDLRQIAAQIAHQTATGQAP